jgi:hypothetical protein
MNGKATLLVVAGFSLIFLVVGKNLGNISSRAVDNSVEYFNQTVAHELAVSSANLAANQIFFDNSWDKGFDKMDFKGGKIKATVNTLDVVKNLKQIVAEGEYNGQTHTVEVTLAPSSFSKFAYMSSNDPNNLYWTNEDTIYGPFHTQGDINAYKHPVFWGKTTLKGKVKYKNSEEQDKPYFYGGFEQGVDLDLPKNGVDNVESIASSGGKVFNLKSGETMHLTFKGDSISYKIVKGLLNTIVEQGTSPSKTFSSNGVIFVKGGDVKLQGTVKGQFTLGTDKSVYLEDDVVYKTDPRNDPNSTDILGIVSKNNVLITENIANKTDGINIHASIYCQDGGFGAGWSSFLVPCGKINLLGGIQNKCRVQIGVINGGNLLGFTRAYKYDQRLALMSPPFYPGTGKYEIVSWKE